MLRKGLHVEKIIGYAFPGIVRSVFRTGAGRLRCVVECSVPGCEGMLHIFNPDQLRAVPAKKRPALGGDAGRKSRRDAEPGHPGR